MAVAEDLPKHLPVLDFSHFAAVPARSSTFLAELRQVASTVGFFYLEGHGIDQGLIDSVLAVSRRFFALPDADKLAIEMVNSPHFRGYNRAGQELTRGQRDWREQVDIGPEREALPFGDASCRRGRACRARTNGPARCRNSSRHCSRWQSELNGTGRTAAARFRRWRSSRTRTSSSRSTGGAAISSSRSFATRAARRPKATRASAPTRTAGFLTLLLQESQKGLEVETEDRLDRGRAEAGDASSSTSARSSKWPPTAISGRRCTAW